MASLSMPAAIVVGFAIFGALTGLGVYFGLRGHAPADGGFHPSLVTPDEASRTMEAGAPAPPTIAPLEPGRAADGATIAARGGSAEGARRAIDGQHAHLAAACWAPSFARTQVPPRVTLTLTLEYGENGRLVIHSLQQNIGGARADVTMCVDKELVLPVTIDPPGRRVRVAVPIAFP